MEATQTMTTTDDTDAPADTAAPVPTYTLDTAAASVRAFGTALAGQFVEREREVASMVLATVAQEHVLLLGPPGTAKSALTVALSRGLGLRSFVRLMGKSTVPEELFGPWDLSGLDESPTRFERVVTGYLPSAQVAFLDEIFKANSAILNNLLTILNEREFDQGATRLQAPLEIAVGASNEYPQDDALAALYDRFMVRHWVGYIRDESAFTRMLSGPPAADPVCDMSAVAVLRDALPTVDVSALIPAIVKIRHALEADHNIVVSDRRWRKSVGLIRAAAVIAGRTIARPVDLNVLVDCLWNRHEDADVIRATVLKYGNPALTQAREFRAVADALIAQVTPPGKTLKDLQPSDLSKAGNALDELRKVQAEARKVCDLKDPDVVAEIQVIIDRASQLRNAIHAAVGTGVE